MEESTHPCFPLFVFIPHPCRHGSDDKILTRLREGLRDATRRPLRTFTKAFVRVQKNRREGIMAITFPIAGAARTEDSRSTHRRQAQHEGCNNDGTTMLGRAVNSVSGRLQRSADKFAFNRRRQTRTCRQPLHPTADGPKGCRGCTDGVKKAGIRPADA